jgi:hypothetical protein
MSDGTYSKKTAANVRTALQWFLECQEARVYLQKRKKSAPKRAKADPKEQ